MPKQSAAVGDVFVVPLEDGTFGVGQVLEIAPSVLKNCFSCAFFEIRLSSEPGKLSSLDLTERSALAYQFVTLDLFDSGIWKRVGNVAPRIPDDVLPHRGGKDIGWVGTKVIGSGIIRMLLNAYFGLRPWSEMHDPTYYDKLLIAGRRGPLNENRAKPV